MISLVAQTFPDLPSYFSTAVAFFFSKEKVNQ